MSKVLLPHEGVMRRLTTWQEEQASTQQAKLETNETEDSAGADEQQQQADANKPAPDMEPLPPDDDYDDSVPDWGEALEDERDSAREVKLTRRPELRLQSVEPEPVSDGVRLQSVEREEPEPVSEMEVAEVAEPPAVKLQSVQREEPEPTYPLEGRAQQARNAKIALAIGAKPQTKRASSSSCSLPQTKTRAETAFAAGDAAADQTCPSPAAVLWPRPVRHRDAHQGDQLCSSSAGDGGGGGGRAPRHRRARQSG